MSEDRSGIAKALVAGVGALIITTIIVLVYLSTIEDANLLRATASATEVTDESGYINETTYTLANFDGINRGFVIVTITNATDNELITSPNYTFTASTGVLTNATEVVWEDVNINYTYIPPTEFETATDRMTSNMTSGVDNVSAKIPTILLLGAVVLLFGVLILLIRYAQEMGLGGRGSL